MASELATLLSELPEDAWRTEVGFGPEIESCHRVMFNPQTTEKDIEASLSGWLQKYQPCLFGRIAAKLSLLSYCILTESDLAKNDEAVRDKIQGARTQWTRAGFEGRKSGFVILVVSPKIAYSVPDETLLRFARRLCSLYLLEEITPGQAHMDEIFLEIPGQKATTWRWNVGANYFCANGDKRWWHDHRVPGGMAFSMNSVGHMVKSGILASKMNELNDLLEVQDEGHVASKVDSLEKALEMAMRTIWLAAETVSGKATQLLPLPADPSQLPVPQCPVQLPSFLANSNHCEYRGYYDTDVTLPVEYFSSAVERPKAQQTYELDFTYLFHESVENPDLVTMGRGRRIRGIPQFTSQPDKLGRGVGQAVQVSEYERLQRAIE